MEQKDLNRLNMWKAVFRVLQDNQPVWIQNEGFAGTVADLNGFIDAADAVAGVHASATTPGITSDKEALADLAIAKTLRVTQVAKAYARKHGNHTLLQAVDFGKGVLVKVPLDELTVRLQTMLQAALGVKTEIGKWGFISGSDTEATSAIEAFRGAASGTRVVISGRKAVTATLPQIMRGGKSELLVLDDLIGLYQDVAPAFVGTYKAARTIVDAGRRKEKPEGAQDEKAALN